MVNISLRDYYKEIDSLISNGQFTLAVDHCKHILNTYPKDFESYRLLGKAYLQDKDIVQAADIFERALAIRPDDFVANVGMSCIREEEGNVDAAIWHMERAFELDASTPTIQSELKRLYTLRDGESPQKIRLTKGALIRMYSKGGMLQQAISEIQIKFSSLEERPDILILLANLYCQTGQMDEAVVLCQKIIQNLPYCFDANLILYNNADSSSDNSVSSIYRDRIIETNPYYAFIQDFGMDVNTVPDDAVMLMKVNPEVPDTEMDTNNKMPAWFSEESQVLHQPASKELESPSPEISTVTYPQEELEFSKMEIPSDTAAEEQTSVGFETAPPQVDLPEWMKESGWKPEASQAELNGSEPEPAPAGNVLPSDIPEWVQGMAPAVSESSGEDGSNLADKSDLSEILFSNMENGVSPSVVEMENNIPIIPDEGISEVSPPEAIEETSAIPEWLQGFDPTQQNKEKQDLEKSIPDWLDAEESSDSIPLNKPFTLEDISGFQADVDAAIPLNEFPGTAPLSPESIAGFEKPEWLKETQAEEEIKSLFASAEKADQPDKELSNWLNNLRPDTTIQSSENISQAEGDIPDWLREPQPEPHVGDTEPLVLINQTEQENLDFWVPEHIESEPAPEFRASESSEVSNVSAFFDDTSGQEKTMPEFAPETQENQESAFSIPDLPAFQDTPSASFLPSQKDNINRIIDYYSQQLKSDNNITEIIDEIKKLTGEYPAEPGIWLLLGDAYHHNKQIQAALDAYARAEEFLSK